MLAYARYVVLAAMIFAVAAAQGSAQTSSPTIRVAGPPVDSAAEMFYAADMGFFDKAGLHVQITGVNSSGTIAAAVASGAIEIGSLTVPTVAVARDKGIPLIIIAPAAHYDSKTPTSGLIVSATSSVKRASDLNGKIIAVRDITSMSYYGAKVWIDKNGGDSTSVRFVELPDSEAAAALRQGRIDAASITSPDLGQALAGDDRLVASIYDAVAPIFLVGVYFTSEAYAKAHPDLVRKFYDVISATALWANKNREQSALILAKYRQAPLPAGIPRVTYSDKLRISEIQPLLDVLSKYGALKSPASARGITAAEVPLQK